MNRVPIDFPTVVTKNSVALAVNYCEGRALANSGSFNTTTLSLAFPLLPQVFRAATASTDMSFRTA
jgi:hypothetical protein